MSHTLKGVENGQQRLRGARRSLRRGNSDTKAAEAIKWALDEQTIKKLESRIDPETGLTFQQTIRQDVRGPVQRL